MLHSICQQIWKIQQWPQDWKRSVFILTLKKSNAKECSNYHTIALISHSSKIMLKIFQARLQHYMNWELPDVQAGFRKGEEPDVKLPTSIEVKLLSHVRLFATPWTVVHQAPPSIGFFRQEYWSRLPFPSPGDVPDPGIKPGSPALRADALTSEPPGKPSKSIPEHLLLLHLLS